jgi:outer membrane lipoprotein carrier protein
VRSRLLRFASLVAASACAAVALTASPRAADPTAAELAQTLQRKYESIKDFSANFVHSYRGGVLHKELTERGRLLVKKPGKMRWEYTAPEKKLFVSDGVKLYSYLPDDKQVMVNTIPRQDEATTPALFLAGKGNLTRDFAASIADPPKGSPPLSRALKFVPKASQPDYDWLVVVFDPSFSIRGLVTADAQGGQSAFSFTDLQENVGLTDKAFTFTIPRGVEVISDASR